MEQQTQPLDNKKANDNAIHLISEIVKDLEYQKSELDKRIEYYKSYRERYLRQ